ncbi:hypothetical protein IEQ34_016336 [Dendrobium chrysotoxum]|uniref:Uncharacterized protein n=1 Tax=Dendrobium chrysotoxum TaxID=161865 RepID=A0AAV7GFU0_DENCH|nr:hypothetical protein IEQ34_016336 [Dendrobium chrysotoxum]
MHPWANSPPSTKGYHLKVSSLHINMVLLKPLRPKDFRLHRLSFCRKPATRVMKLGIDGNRSIKEKPVVDSIISLSIEWNKFWSSY